MHRRSRTSQSLTIITALALTVAGCSEDPAGPDPGRDAIHQPAWSHNGTSATIAGVTGVKTDAEASSDRVLRYTGNPVSNWGGAYSRATPRIVTASPEAGPVTFEGTIDVGDQVTGQVSMIGLIDFDVLASGAHGFQSGAYMYIFRRTDTEWRIGVTDGNEGGEIVQTFLTIPEDDMPDNGVFTVTFTIDGTADPTTCAVGAVTSAAGCLTLAIAGGNVNATLHDSYGDITGSGSGTPEFANGGIPGWDDFLPANVGYDLTISPATVVDDEGPITSDVVASPNPVAVTEGFLLTATVDDALTGAGIIASAEYTLDGGTTWTPLDPQDGAFDEVQEVVSASVAPVAEPGLLEVCVRGTDDHGNTGEAECITVAVYDPAGGFVTGGGWFTSQEGAFMPTDETVVTAANLGVNWTLEVRDAGAGAFAGGPGAPPLGGGSFQMSSTSSADKATLFNFDHIGTLLADIEAIRYATWRSSTSTNPAPQYPSINLVVDFVGDGSSFTTLVWEPVYAFGQGALATDTWQTWDAMAPSQTTNDGGWWSTREIPGVCPFSCFVSWETIVANNPNAKVLGGFGVNIGSGWDGEFSGAVDALSITTTAGTTTYDFEADAPPSGKATFAFVSKYKKGASTPDGNTQFTFMAAGLEFHSTSYEWLIVNQGGSNAQFKGSGTINGSGDYRFMLWAGDHDDGDTFRIRIWEETGGSELVIYDNGFGQAIEGGNIIVHAGKGGK